MRMVGTEKSLYVREREVRPNRYAGIVLLFTLIWIIGCWILNEIGIFRVGDFEMRIGCSITIIVIAIPLILLKFRKSMISDPRMKYIIVIAGGLFTMASTTLITFHTTILLLFPIFMAMMYKSKSLGMIALFSSLFCTVFSIILSYGLGAWDIPLLKELITIGTNGTVEVTGADPAVTGKGLCEILLYIILPRLLMIGSCSILMFYVIKMGAESVEQQIQIHRMSYLDALTGLYNRNYYKEIVDSKQEGPVGIIFLDVNGLKKANDEHGHEYGDVLLKRCGRSIINVCNEDDSVGIRLGGDEFIMIIDGADEKAALAKLDEWNDSLKEINNENSRHYEGMICSMAVGIATGDYKNLPELVNRADEYMYINKEANRN